MTRASWKWREQVRVVRLIANFIDASPTVSSSTSSFNRNVRGDDNRLPEWGTAVECVVWAVVALAAGSWVFTRHQRRLAEVL